MAQWLPMASANASSMSQAGTESDGDRRGFLRRVGVASLVATAGMLGFRPRQSSAYWVYCCDLLYDLQWPFNACNSAPSHYTWYCYNGGYPRHCACCENWTDDKSSYVCWN